ncbi:MAG: copper resistance protein CopC [Terrimesophilobacter sp.]
MRSFSATARQVTLAGIVAAVAVLGLATPAHAHNYYVDSTPSENDVLTNLPDEFVVTTNDNLLDLGAGNGGFLLETVGPDGLYYGDGCVTVSGPSVTTTAAVGPPGAYTLNWQVVSTDGHTESGVVPFTWQPPADYVATSTGSTSPPNCGGTAVAQAATPAPDASSESNTDILWIGGAILAVAVAGIATFLLLGRKKST